MDPEDTRDTELDRLLTRATTSALRTLESQIDVARLLRDLHDTQDPPPTDDE
jgi:hypothetical protein